uniref:Uncharacterized protein n=1 Tax=Glossina pallidipes TaxID=7398 RepID=A0A1A9ZWM5_GLOPL
MQTYFSLPMDNVLRKKKTNHHQFVLDDNSGGGGRIIADDDDDNTNSTTIIMMLTIFIRIQIFEKTCKNEQNLDQSKGRFLISIKWDHGLCAVRTMYKDAMHNI